MNNNENPFVNRHYLPLLLTLFSNEKNDQRTLTGHYRSMSGFAVIRSESFFQARQRHVLRVRHLCLMLHCSRNI